MHNYHRFKSIKDKIHQLNLTSIESTASLKSFRILLPVLSLLIIALTACGSSGDSQDQLDAFAQITPSERSFTIDDFKPANFKISHEYDVEGLIGAISASNGFWKPSGTVAKEYEMRFYASHADAIELGTSLAIEASGETALLDEEDATWDEGLKDRRAFFAGGVGTHGSGSVQAMYGGYAIYGNMVMLCEGANQDQDQLLARPARGPKVNRQSNRDYQRPQPRYLLSATING
jgi:hypothetical protein